MEQGLGNITKCITLPTDGNLIIKRSRTWVAVKVSALRQRSKCYSLPYN